MLGGAVHDIVVLFVSLRYNGESLASIPKNEIGKTGGAVTSLIMVFIFIIIICAGKRIHGLLSIEDEPAPGWGKECAFAETEGGNEANRSM